MGPPIIEVGGDPLRVDTRKATALLIYLAERREPQRRESLAALFWPESDASHSKAALRRTLSALRKAVGGDWVSANRDTVSLQEPRLDTREFRRLLADTGEHGHLPQEVCERCHKPLTDAAELYRDSFLSGFTLPDSPDFDEWQYFTSQSLRQQHSDGLRRLIQLHERAESYELAVGYANRLLALDALDESAHRHLMALYARLGQRGQALQQYRECVRVLQEELGAPPLDETIELNEKVKAGEIVAAQTGVERVRLPVDEPSKLPFIGRQPELVTIRRIYSDIETEPAMALIEGEVGVGKTRLVEEFLSDATATILQARCYPGEESVAYRPWIDALRSSLATGDLQSRLKGVSPIWLTEATRLLPEIPELLRDVDPPSADLDNRGQDRYQNGLIQVLGALAHSDTPGILFFDDLQWADDASLELIAYLMRRGPDPPVFVLGAWRVESVADEARMRAWFSSLPDRRSRVVALGLLDQGAVAELVASVETEATAEKLFEETEGSPLFLAEYLAALQSGTIEIQGGEWKLPAHIQEVLRARLVSVTGATQQLLGAAAVIGRSFDFEILKEVSGRSIEEVVAGLENLIRLGFVREFPEQQAGLGPSYDFKHHKFRELALAETTQARQRLLHARAAERMQRARGSESALASRIARHYELAGDEATASERYIDAGQHARSLYANEEALAHFESALALGSAEPGFVHEEIADLQTLLGKYDLAAQEYEAAAAFQTNGGVARIEHKLGGLYERWGKRERAVGHYESAVESTSDDGELARIYADWSLTEHREGRHGRSRELIDLATQHAELADDPKALAQCHNILGILARASGEGRAAQDHLTRSLEYAELLDDPSARAAALNNLALAVVAEGNHERALELELEALQISESYGDRHRSAALHSNLADILYESGDQAAAENHLSQSAALFSDVGVVSGVFEPEIWKLVEW